MKLSTGSELRVFNDGFHGPETNLAHDQLPFLAALSDQFELVTGWKLAFHENRLSLNDRKVDSESSVFGQLEITDLSANLSPGRNARHRAHCDQLVETLDALIELIQSDRERFRTLDKNLSPVVPSPFDWWAIEGSCGFSAGTFSSWSISPDETIRIFAGQSKSEDSFQSALAASMILSAFETACEASLAIDEIAPLIPAVLQRSHLGSSSLTWFSTLELDPITGEYEIDGYDATNGLTLVDVDAGKALAVDAEEKSNVLFSGQILCVGIGGREVINQIDALLSGGEYSVEQSLNMVRQEFADTAAIFLYRR